MKTPREFSGKFSDDNAAGLPDSDLGLLAEMVDLRDCEHAAEFARRTGPALEMLRRLEWSRHDSSVGDDCCPVCLACRGYNKGVHKQDCLLRAALSLLLGETP